MIDIRPDKEDNVKFRTAVARARVNAARVCGFRPAGLALIAFKLFVTQHPRSRRNKKKKDPPSPSDNGRRINLRDYWIRNP